MNERSNIPSPIFSSTPTVFSGRITCFICFQSSTKKNKKRDNFQKIDKARFIKYAEKWKNVDHEYNNVYSKVDWNLLEFYGHLKCKGPFFNEHFLRTQPILPTDNETNSVVIQSISEIDDIPGPSNEIRKSSRLKFSYSSSRLGKEKLKCIICNAKKKDKKGRDLPLTLLTYKNASTDTHKVEENLLKFSKVHKEKQTSFIEGAERILLTATTNSLFAADTAYHRAPCYTNFCAHSWIREKTDNNSQIYEDSNDICLQNIIQLIKLHVVERKEVYTLSQLRSFYKSLHNEGVNCRSIDLKEKLIDYFGNEIQFQTGKRSEYVLPVGPNLTSECISASISGVGIPDTISIRSSARIVHDSVKDFKKEQTVWPPTPQAILDTNFEGNKDLYNLIGWIINPNARLDENNRVVLSKTKKTRVNKICHDIESLLPNSGKNSFHLLLSLILHRKTGSQDVIDICHRLGHCASYTETLFTEDKWAEWDSVQTTNIPANIKKGKETTHVADNIDWKNKTVSSKETHHTNSILIQHCEEMSLESKVKLSGNYDFDRSSHRSFKGTDLEIPEFIFKKTDCPILQVPEERIKSPEICFVQASKKTLAWVMSRYSSPLVQTIPGWGGFMEQVVKRNKHPKVRVGYLPPIRDSPTKINVVHAIFTRTINIMKELELSHIFLEVDQAIYNKILKIKIQLLKENKQLYDRVIIRMGGFHIMICVMRTIYSQFKGFGFVELMAEVGVSGYGTLENGMRGGDIKSGIRFYKLLFESLVRLKIEKLSQQMSHKVLEHGSSFKGHIDKLRSDITSENLKEVINHPDFMLLPSIPGDMCMWLERFLQMVDILINLIHFQRTGNWTGFLELIYIFLPFCFSLNRTKYARDLSYYYIDMKDLERRNPRAHSYLLEGGFVGSLSGTNHSSIPMDQIIECTINRLSKSVGGLSGLTENVGANEKWVRLNPYLCALKEHLNRTLSIDKCVSNVELGIKRIERDECAVQSIMRGLKSWIPDIWMPNKPLINIYTGVPASLDLISNFKTVIDRGCDARNSYFQRFVGNNLSSLKFFDPIKKQTSKTFADKMKKAVLKSIPEDEGSSFYDVIQKYHDKVLDLRFILNWPVTSKPWAISCEDDKNRSNNKSLFRNALQQLSPIKPVTTPPEDINCCIVDAMRVLRIITPSGLKPPTFLTWAKAIGKYINSLPGNTAHIVFDTYLEKDDFAYPTKNRCTVETARLVSSLSQKLPMSNDWFSFLSNNSNKIQIISLLVDFFLTMFETNKEVVINRDNNCLERVGNHIEKINDLTNNHREADPKLPFHAVYAASKVATGSVCVVSDDTDVFILLLYACPSIIKTIYFRQGTQNKVEYHNITSLFSHLGTEVCSILPHFHALTGCDFTYPFYFRSKYQAFKKMISNQSMPQLISLQTDSADIETITNFVLHTIYNRPLTENSPGQSRYNIMVGKKTKGKDKYISTKRIPPDQKSLKMKIKRANFITHVWCNCLDGGYTALNPQNYGWKLRSDRLEPIWFEGNSLPTDEEYEQHLKEIEVDDDDNNVNNNGELESDSDSSIDGNHPSYFSESDDSEKYD